jgi:hypothetical protein
VIALVSGGAVVCAGLGIAIAATAAPRDDATSSPVTAGATAGDVTAASAVASGSARPSAAAASGRATGSRAVKEVTTSGTAEPGGKAGAKSPGTVLAKDEAEDVVKDAAEASVKQPKTLKQLRSAAGKVTSEHYLKDLESQWQELDAYGWDVSGAPKVLSVKVMSRSPKRHTAIVSACIDSSAVRFVDAKGRTVNAKAKRPGPATQLFTLKQDEDGRWRIEDRSFPADPSCAATSHRQD